MNLNTPEKFLLLIQHSTKTRFILSEQIINAGFIGSILLDLANDKNIEIVDGKLIVKSSATKLITVHKDLLAHIENTSRKRKVKTWISKLSRKTRTYKKSTLIDLEEKGVIKLIYKKFLFFKYYRTKLVNNDAREQLIHEIREVIFNNKKVDDKASLILGLIEACKMQKIICLNKGERKICKNRVKEIMESDAISQGVDRVIKDMQATIMLAVVASTAATVASGN